jgi:hypothetical protein
MKPVEQRGKGLRERCNRSDAGRGHEQVEPAMPASDLSEGGNHRRLVGDVEHDAVGIGIRIKHNDARALRAEPPNDGRANAACAARDHRDLVMKAHDLQRFMAW